MGLSLIVSPSFIWEKKCEEKMSFIQSKETEWVYETKMVPTEAFCYLVAQNVKIFCQYLVQSGVKAKHFTIV